VKILIISHYFPPLNSIASLRAYSWAKYWGKLGHEITIFTTEKPKSPQDLSYDLNEFEIIKISLPLILKKFKSLKKKQSSEAIPATNKSFLREFLLTYKQKLFEKTGILGTSRMPDFLDFIYFGALNKLKNRKWDFVISTHGPYVCHLIGKKLKENQQAALWIADYRDLWTQNHIFRGLFPFNLIEEYLEKEINNSADLITTVSQPLVELLQNKYKFKKISKVQCIENGFDFEDLQKISQRPLWQDEKIRLVYTGTIYKNKQDPGPLFQAIKRILYSSNKNLLSSLQLVFAGPNKTEIDLLAKNYSISDYVLNLGLVSHEKALRIQRDAHVLVFLDIKNSYSQGILTGKIFEYLNSGTITWIIGGSAKSSARNLLEKTGCGVVLSEDIKKIEEQLIKLLKSSQKPSISPKLDLISRYSRKILAEKLLKLVSTIHAL